MEYDMYTICASYSIIRIASTVVDVQGELIFVALSIPHVIYIIILYTGQGVMHNLYTDMQQYTANVLFA